jgi:putative membrane-bound dehydrogenase-like protein
MKHLAWVGMIWVASSLAVAQESKPLRIFIRAGEKTHGPGEHDHPRFLKEWTELLRSRGCTVEGALGFPTQEQLEKTDVLVMFAAEAGTVPEGDRAALEGYLKRGGGIVAIHDSVCGQDPQWYKTVIGGAWEHGKSKFHNGHVGIYVQDYLHPITRGLSNFFMDDEIYWDLHLMPEAKVIGTAFRMFNEVTPQMWVYEKDNYRAFVNLQGHQFASFGLPHYRTLLLRGIAWAGKREVDLLVTKEELASLRYPPGGPLPPGVAREKIGVPSDFDLGLVLAEPEIVKPISIGWDPQGRLWVAQTPMYPDKAELWKARPRDSLVWFDSRGRKTVFYDQLDLVTSFVFHKDGVIVMQAPEILFLRDPDRGGVCTRREVLFSGFGYRDTHAVASNLRWGLDGWIYGTQGYSGGGSNVLNRDGKPMGKIGNGIFRFRPDGSEIEVVSSYNSNTWGMDFSWDGEIFFSMANASHVRHVVLPDGVLSRGRAGGLKEGWKEICDHRDANAAFTSPINPYLQIDNVGGFTATAGSTLYDGGAWPDEYRSIHFVTECTLNLVHQDRIRPEGVTYVASKVRPEEFIAATDLWFRPIDTQVGPDGALYIVDFYNQAVVHNDTRGPKHDPYNAAIRPDRDHLHGRIWRLQHKEARTLPSADFTAVSGLVHALEHPNRWDRLTAQRLLVERGEGAIEAAALLKATAKPETKVLCLWILQRLGKLPASEIVAALGDRDAGVRKNAARLAALAGQGEELQKALLSGLEDPDARARLEKIVALGSFPSSSAAAGLLLRIYPGLKDDYSRSAAVGALAASPLEALAAAIDLGDRALAEELAGAIASRQNADLAAQAIIGISGRSGNSIKQAALLRLAKVLRPDLEPAVTPELRKAFGLLLGTPELVSATLPFAGRWVKDESMAKALEPVTRGLLASIADASKPDDVRIQEFAALLAIAAAKESALGAAAGLLVPSSSADLQKGVIEALGGITDRAIAPVLVAAYPKLAGGAREAILSQLLRRPDWASFLLGEVEGKRVRPNELGPNAVFRLRNHPDGATSKRARTVFDAVMGDQSKAKDVIIASLLPAVEKQGDPARGRQLLTEICLKCHVYKGEGRGLAPDLTGMGVHGKRDLLIHVIDPNRVVEANYVSFNVRTKAGDVFNGIVARETRDTVFLRSAEGDREVRRADIDVMVSTGLSLMPEGLESLGGAALCDLLTFLCSEAGGFRIIDLQTAFTASSVKGLFDPVREPNNLRLRKYGIHVVEGVPFQVVDPSKSLNGNNAIVLKGGLAPDWHSKVGLPQKVEVPMGFACEKIHVLGGIAAWGTLNPEGSPQNLVRVTYFYADGKSEVKELRDGVEFADWVKRIDVTGSKYVEGLIEPGQPGQVRWFTMTPGRREPIHHLSLESYDNQMAPTFLALTAQISGTAGAPAAARPAKVLIVGGGSSHDFDTWFKGADGETLRASYTADVKEILPALEKIDVLFLSNNQPIADAATRKGIFDFADRGKGLLLVHPACWYNWKDWPEYNQMLVGGGARGHEKYQEFEVTALDEAHPVMAGVPKKFRVKDELYQFQKDPEGPEIAVLARGTSLQTGKEYPVVWTVKHPKGRIVCITLGHDGAAHDLDAYKKLLQNAASWVVTK